MAKDIEAKIRESIKDVQLFSSNDETV
jgi:hypothetical protein